MVAAVSVTWMIVHMWRAGRRMKGDIEGHLRESSAKPGAAAFLGVFLFTLLMISREGMETALLLMQLRETLHLALGAAIGVGGAAGIAWLWSRYGHRVNLGLFFQVTAIFLFVFVVQLLIAGFHEMSEQHFLPFSEPIHVATESWGPDSIVRPSADVPAGDPAARLADDQSRVLEAAGLAPKAPRALSESAAVAPPPQSVVHSVTPRRAAVRPFAGASLNDTIAPCQRSRPPSSI